MTDPEEYGSEGIEEDDEELSENESSYSSYGDYDSEDENKKEDLEFEKDIDNNSNPDEKEDMSSPEK